MPNDRIVPVLEEIFRAVFNRPEAADVSGIRQLTEHTWDSLAHVSLVSAIESEFGITIDTGDAIELTSFEAMRLYLEDAVR